MPCDPFTSQRDAALALLNDPDARLTRKAGSLCGQLAVDPQPMTSKQKEWFSALLDRAGLPPLVDGGEE